MIHTQDDLGNSMCTEQLKRSLKKRAVDNRQKCLRYSISQWIHAGSKTPYQDHSFHMIPLRVFHCWLIDNIFCSWLSSHHVIHPAHLAHHAFELHQRERAGNLRYRQFRRPLDVVNVHRLGGEQFQ